MVECHVNSGALQFKGDVGQREQIIPHMFEPE
jgi:hypothetical protein